LITEQDLLEAIAECQGERNPNANTCIKLAAYLTIKNELYPAEAAQLASPVQPAYSFAAEPSRVVSTIHIDSDSDFARAVDGRDPEEIWPIIDELMESLQVMHPRLYEGVMRELG
jgi:hypothetical protein